jgi:hypothetical protein
MDILLDSLCEFCNDALTYFNRSVNLERVISGHGVVTPFPPLVSFAQAGGFM